MKELRPALTCLFSLRKRTYFFLNSFQLQESQVTDLKPNKPHRITGNKDKQERERETEQSASKGVCVLSY